MRFSGLIECNAKNRRPDPEESDLKIRRLSPIALTAAHKSEAGPDAATAREAQ
jgi:hypothetical protein